MPDPFPVSLGLPARLRHVAGMIGALAGRPVARWSPRPALPPAAAPQGIELGQGIRLWRLPLGVVRIRARHRALPPHLAQVEDDFRFPVMMSDSRITPWLDCTAWLIDHPEGRILVDTGEAAAFGTRAYFGSEAARMARVYPRIIDATAAPGNTLPAALVAVGVGVGDLRLCVLTHLHSDHIGNLPDLTPATPLIVAPPEMAPTPRSGRLTGLLPQDGRVTPTALGIPDPIFGAAMALTARGDVRVVPTPGHTVGHQSVVIDLGARQVVLAGDAAFDDQQVAQGILPGIVEDGRAARDTCDRLRRLAAVKPTLTLFTHDPANAAKLAAWAAG